uniref:transmembrane protein 200A n=1 Tax=Doryrhamphus excisus TaxID=161450 RepID=UPI0025AE172C|nr:transmembrane protein 200A [Doryrhamphus excisus]XP_057918660.1 transmembrane protein 200A [Doryrhamphus excisus]XP_057918661.1 transmembrane protein 200A [Doryrhamphus excisus]
MIATGGLLRMNRRQDSLRSKNRAENKKKRKSKKKKKNDVVVVKGKLNLCSPAGLVAAAGVVVLVMGISMAILGYWPSQNQQQYQERRRTGGHNKMSFSQSPNVSSNGGRDPSNQTKLLDHSHSNSSDPTPSAHCGFLCDFLDNYLYSDNLKVFGPLVMGIGIFLFICANAVLHENRDKKTKIINLRDIYSTVIDLHSVRSKEYSPLNGLVNYTQSKSAEGPLGSHPPSGMHTRSSWPSTGLNLHGELGGEEVFRRPSLASRTRSWSKDVQTFTDTVYSIYKDYSNSGEEAPQPRQWETTSIVTSSVNAFTLPVIKLNNCEVEAPERAASEGRPQEGVVIQAENIGEEEQTSGGHLHKTDAKDKDPPTAGPPSPQRSHEDEQGPRQDPPQWTQLFPPSPIARAMGSRLSLNSLTDQPRSARRCSLSASVCRQGDRGRRLSCPRLERSNSKGYIKLSDLGGESFEAPDTSLADPEQDVAAADQAPRDEGLTTPDDSVEP